MLEEIAEKVFHGHSGDQHADESDPASDAAVRRAPQRDGREDGDDGGVQEVRQILKHEIKVILPYTERIGGGERQGNDEFGHEQQEQEPPRRFLRFLQAQRKTSLPEWTVLF